VHGHAGPREAPGPAEQLPDAEAARHEPLRQPEHAMPKKGVSLPSADIATIGNWICEGAPNN
jgi:hypothetical protein